MRCARALVAAAALALSPGCLIARTYVGNEVAADSERKLVPGTTTKAEVLRELGPPDRLVRQYEGDVFVYAYVRKNTETFELSEPVFTHLRVFSYTKDEEKSDRLVVLFDRAGIVTGVGFRRGTEQLGAF